jgi:sec-independent protein translocase protein TatB
MFPLEQGALEFVVIAAIGLMVLGPKDLPIVMRRLGQFMAKMRGMAAEFRASFDELARQSEIDQLRKEVEALRTGEFGSTSTSASPPAEPTYDYNPYDNASAGLDNTGFTFPPQPSTTEPPIMGEGLPPAEAEAPTKPARKPRAKKVPVETPAVVEQPPAAKPRRTRAKPTASQTDDAGE